MFTEQDEEKLSELVKRAAGDKKLQKSLVDDPAQFLRSRGVAIPEGIKVTAVADKDSLSLRLQSQRGGGDDAELTDSALDAVVGGKGTSGKGTSDAGHIYLQFNFKLVAVKTIS